MKETELRLISELMRNSRRSDRELEGSRCFSTYSRQNDQEVGERGHYKRVHDDTGLLQARIRTLGFDFCQAREAVRLRKARRHNTYGNRASQTRKITGINHG